MTSPIDPIRKTGRPRRTLRPKGDAVDPAHEVSEDRSLPVVAGPAITHEPEHTADAASVFSAQLMGQDGQKRGLRGGQKVIGDAHNAYASTEWSGPIDRRTRRGGVKKTDV